MSRRDTTIIVGGGCSGAMTAAHLLDSAADRVVLIEPSERLGRGIAYRTTDAVHLLNSRAGSMSAVPERPSDFTDWCHARQRPVPATAFLPRQVYGGYLSDVLDRAVGAAPDRFRRVHGRADRVLIEPTPEPDGDAVAVVLRDGTRVGADRVILATGHAAPADPPAVTPDVRLHPRYLTDPWTPRALETVPPDAPVLLLGTGLTAVDVALSLVTNGHRGPVHTVSRHGLLPLSHTDAAAPVVTPPEPEVARSLAGLVRALRRAATEADDWRAVVDGIRPLTDAYWRTLPVAARERFIRHLARYWEVHRHRMAPDVARAVDRLRAAGALTVEAARLTQISARRDGFLVEAAGRSGQAPQWSVAAIVNCTGPGNPARTPLIARLIADGLARPDRLGLGIDIDDDGRPIGADDHPTHRLVAIGPLRRGRWWETTAVPEIRAQVGRSRQPTKQLTTA